MQLCRTTGHCSPRAQPSLCCDKQKLESAFLFAFFDNETTAPDSIVTAQNRSDMMNSEIIRRYGESRLPPLHELSDGAPLFAQHRCGHLTRLAGRRAGKRSGLPYLHVPFCCRSMCWYCGCHTTITQKMHDPRLPDRAETGNQTGGEGLSDGGRTSATFTSAAARPPSDAAGIPRSGCHACRSLWHREHDRACGGNRPRTLTVDMSVALGRSRNDPGEHGVQSFDPKVQKAINRIQFGRTDGNSPSKPAQAGARSVNFDLIYGFAASDPSTPR